VIAAGGITGGVNHAIKQSVRVIAAGGIIGGVNHAIKQSVTLRSGLIAGAALCLVACAGGSGPETAGHSMATIALGSDGSGTVCMQQAQPNSEALIYCGDLRQPSGRITRSTVRAGETAAQLSRAGAWRVALERRFACGEPLIESLYGSDAMTMDCVRRIGGWPRVAVVVVIGDTGYFGDADPAASVVLRRGIGVAAGRLSADAAAPVLVDAALVAQRAAAQAVSSHDIREFEALMIAGVRANLTENFAAAEVAFRQAAALQLRDQGPDGTARADPLLHQALQLSNLGHYAESDAVFATASQLLGASRGSLLDATVVPRLALYRGLSLLNQDRAADALPLFDRAEQGFDRLAPPGLAVVRPLGAIAPRGLEAVVANLAEAQLFEDPISAAAVLGQISVRRSRAVALLMLHQPDQSERENQEAQRIADTHAMAQAVLEARILRTAGMIAEAQGGQGRALALLTRSTQAFNAVFPISRPAAETELLRAANLFRQKRGEEGLRVCRRAVDVLQKLHSAGTSVALIMPCLDGLAAAAGAAAVSDAAMLYAEMFVAAQLAQSSLISTQIAEATARLAEAQRDTRVGDAIRRRDDSARTLGDLYRKRDMNGTGALSGWPTAELDRAIERAEMAEAEAEDALGVASPNYRQLVEAAVSSSAMFAVLQPDEAMVAIVVGEDHGWSLALHAGRIGVARIDGGRPRMQALVGRVRASMQPGPAGLPPAFDTAAAGALYQAMLAPVEGLLAGTRRLIVVPSGPLLAIPFGLLLAGPARDDLAGAPWLVQRMTIAHVPAAANFVSLRRAAGHSQAPKSWAGFGDPVPVTPNQAVASFAGADCRRSAGLLSGLSRLPGARAEIELVRQRLNGAMQDELLGAAFTRAAMQRFQLRDFRVLQFATHGLLPAELSCQSEPAVMVSAAPGATDASSALLTASRIAQWDLDADVVILSACNTAGPDGQPAGESLSGLARSFFFAGARALMVTHWAVNDRVTAVLVAGAMQRLQQAPAEGPAMALAAQQRAMLAQATGPIAALAHPFYWAPLALIGEGGGQPAASGRLAGR
jgi:CHAT domain-containing protein